MNTRPDIANDMSSMPAFDEYKQLTIASTRQNTANNRSIMAQQHPSMAGYSPRLRRTIGGLEIAHWLTEPHAAQIQIPELCQNLFRQKGFPKSTASADEHQPNTRIRFCRSTRIKQTNV